MRYTRLVTNINAFVDEGLCLPSKIKVSINDLKGNSDILTNLQHNNAKYHKSCALELSSSRLQRARFSRDKMRQNEDGLNEAPNDVPAKRTRTNVTTESPLRSSICFFCNEVGLFSSGAKKNEKSSTFLHRVTTMNRDQNIRECAIQMGDTKLLAKLSEGDMGAREACYHLRCMTKFTNTYRSFAKKNCRFPRKLVNIVCLSLVCLQLFV